MESKKKFILQYIVDIILTIVSAGVISLGIKVFVSPNRFLSTGVTGLAIIIGRLYDNLATPAVSLETTITSILYFVFNVPVIILSIKKLSKRFTILSIISVLTTSLFLVVLPDNLNELLGLSVAKGDISFLDAALFVGLMNGAANAILFIVGGSAGGTDVLSMYFSVIKQITVGRLSVIINGVIILLGMLVDGEGNAIPKAFYTLVYLVISSIVIDLFYVRNKRNIVYITTSKGKEISDVINQKYIRGVTKISATGAFTGEARDLLYCACTSFEVDGIIKEITKIDEHAFISVVPANKIIGNFINKDLR